MNRPSRAPFSRSALGAFLAFSVFAGPPGGAAPVRAAGPAQDTPAREAIVMDATTGTILFQKDADKPMPPASMSKMMTVYMLFERLKHGRVSLDDSFTVSQRAWTLGGAKSGGSTMFLQPGARVRVEDLLRGIVVQSGNDACIVVAENLAASEEAFADEMTKRGRELGLTGTVFKNSNGLPDPGHVTTAHDLAILAKRTIDDFPDYYRYYAEMEFTYNGIRQQNRNPLLYRNMGVDGLKTGHTEEAGFGLTASAKRGDRRIIIVVNGLDSRRDRSREPERLLEWGFREFNNYALFNAGEKVETAEVWLGKSPGVPLVVDRDVVLTLPRASRAGLKVAVRYEGPIAAPIAKGDRVATLVVAAPDVETREYPLVSGAAVEQLGFFGRLSEALRYIVWGAAG